MENQIENVLVFATNIATENDKQKISNILDGNTEIQQWTLDLEDIDRVLRIVSDTLSEEQIIKLLDNKNFNCSALE
ncbi:hypothetical protein [Flavobacterium granuli]|uniref:tRNA G26 N,N-dimethylase Trm1 n=1 Tax=Flavobacterium granuli TaxID=280093 RepID=A0ABU1RXZ2_9FLAO|nr:hypothetical protein [Flavobacterium granuli]MDR6843637.1 tRNA G26 N,N-dimethylase Trm1 [Flavobacterium granuli]